MAVRRRRRTARGGFVPSGGGPCTGKGVCWVTGKPMDDGGVRIGLNEIAQDKEGRAVINKGCAELTGSFKSVEVSRHLEDLLEGRLGDIRHWPFHDGRYYEHS